MSGKVVSLAGRANHKDDGPHLSGKFICGACEHEWEGAAPVGDTHAECPRCNRWWGAPKHAVEPPAGGSYWRCGCGETLFWLTPEGAMCRRCGKVPSRWPI